MAYGCTYPIEMYCDRTVRFDRCGLAAQRNHFPEDTYCLIGEGVKVLGIYARSSFGGHCSTDVALRGDRRYEQVMDVSGSPYLINQAMITSVSKGRSRQHVIAAKYHHPAEMFNFRTTVAMAKGTAYDSCTATEYIMQPPVAAVQPFIASHSPHTRTLQDRVSLFMRLSSFSTPWPRSETLLTKSLQIHSPNNTRIAASPHSFNRSSGLELETNSCSGD